MAPRSTTQIPVASRISGFNYAIRNIVAEARRVEAGGTRVRYLNIGDPIIFGFETPPHLVAAASVRFTMATTAMRRRLAFSRRGRRWPTNAAGAACPSRPIGWC